jgi:hypothetical protein
MKKLNLISLLVLRSLVTSAIIALIGAVGHYYLLDDHINIFNKFCTYLLLLLILDVVLFIFKHTRIEFEIDDADL